MTVEPLFLDLINKFNGKVETDEKLQKELEGVEKKVYVDLGQERYCFTLKDKKIQDFHAGTIDNPDVTITSDPQTIQDLIDGKMKPMKAFALRKVKVNGDISDVLRLRKLF